MASLRAAMSTKAGTPVKSCKITRLGLNGISDGSISGDHDAIRRTSSSETRKPSHLLRADSSRILIVNGSSSRLQSQLERRDFRLANLEVEPSAFSNSEIAPNGPPPFISSPIGGPMRVVNEVALRGRTRLLPSLC